jgi:hypothetical protein
MFGVKLGLAGDDQGTVGTRGQSPAAGNRTSNRLRLRLSDNRRERIGRLVGLIAQEHRKSWGWHSSVISMIWWAIMHVNLVEHDRRIGKGTRSYEVLIGVVRREVVALIVRGEVVAMEVLIVRVRIALVEVVMWETVATGIVLRERTAR